MNGCSFFSFQHLDCKAPHFPACSVIMGCQNSKVTAPVAAEKAPITVTEANTESKASTEAPVEPVPSQEVSPSQEESKAEQKDSVVPEPAEASQTVEETKEEPKMEAAVEAVAAAVEEAKQEIQVEAKQELPKEEEVKEAVADFSTDAQEQLKDLKAEVADAPTVLDTAMFGESKTPTCNLFGWCA